MIRKRSKREEDQEGQVGYVQEADNRPDLKMTGGLEMEMPQQEYDELDKADETH